MLRPLLDELGAIIKVALRIGPTWDPTAGRPSAGVLATALRRSPPFAQIPPEVGERLVEELIAGSPGTALRVGHDFLRGGKNEQALQVFDLVLVTHPLALDAHLGRTGALVGLGRDTDALAETELVLDEWPNLPEAHCNRSHVLCALDRFDLALESANRALELSPENPCSLINLSWAHRGMGQLTEAVAMARRAIDLNPQREEAHRRLSEALLELGQLHEALAAIERALELEPDNSLGLAHRDLVRRRIEDEV